MSPPTTETGSLPAPRPRSVPCGRLATVCLAAFTQLAACDGSGPVTDAGTLGEVSVLLEAEDAITEGLAPGTTPEAIQDGWTVTFDDYLVAIGDVDVYLSTDEAVSAGDPTRHVVDLVEVPATGLPLWTLSGLETGRWELGYAVGGGATATGHASVTPDQLAEVVGSDLTYLIAGTMSRADGQSCPPSSLATPGAAAPNGSTNAGGDACYDRSAITFRFALSAPTRYGPCEVDEVPGFAVAAGSTTTVGLTIHGDHLFFNGFPEGAEGGVMRLAQWLADCDLDLDGVVTREELEQIAPSDLPEIDSRFQLGGSPITPLTTVWEYLRAQVKTQGHFQGEGECPLGGA